MPSQLRTKNKVYPPCHRQASLQRRQSLHASGVATREPRTVGRLPSAFTLIELMVVIGIIAILAGLLFPVILGANERAKQKQALAETRTILMAIKEYYQEYKKWPAQIQQATDTTYITNNWIIIQTLFGSNVNYNGSRLNPKEMIFLNLQVNTKGNPDYAGNYLDPWGSPYVICMDENGDNRLTITWINANYVPSNASGRTIYATNIVLTNFSAPVDAGVASMLGNLPPLPPTTLPWNSWTDP